MFIKKAEESFQRACEDGEYLLTNLESIVAVWDACVAGDMNMHELAEYHAEINELSK